MLVDDLIAVRREGTSMDCCDLHIFNGFAFPVVKLCAIIVWDKVSNHTEFGAVPEDGSVFLLVVVNLGKSHVQRCK